MLALRQHVAHWRLRGTVRPTSSAPPPRGAARRGSRPWPIPTRVAWLSARFTSKRVKSTTHTHTGSSSGSRLCAYTHIHTIIQHNTQRKSLGGCAGGGGGVEVAPRMRVCLAKGWWGGGRPIHSPRWDAQERERERERDKIYKYILSRGDIEGVRMPPALSPIVGLARREQISPPPSAAHSTFTSPPPCPPFIPPTSPHRALQSRATIFSPFKCATTILLLLLYTCETPPLVIASPPPPPFALYPSRLLYIYYGNSCRLKNNNY